MPRASIIIFQILKSNKHFFINRNLVTKYSVRNVPPEGVRWSGYLDTVIPKPRRLSSIAASNAGMLWYLSVTLSLMST